MIFLKNLILKNLSFSNLLWKQTKEKSQPNFSNSRKTPKNLFLKMVLEKKCCLEDFALFIENVKLIIVSCNFVSGILVLPAEFSQSAFFQKKIFWKFFFWNFFLKFFFWKLNCYWHRHWHLQGGQWRTPRQQQQRQSGSSRSSGSCNGSSGKGSGGRIGGKIGLVI